MDLASLLATIRKGEAPSIEVCRGDTQESGAPKTNAKFMRIRWFQSRRVAAGAAVQP